MVDHTDDISAVIATLERWRESTRLDFKSAQEEQGTLAEIGDEYGVQHFREECIYLNGRIDAYSDVLLELREKRLGI
jgi:hypothetical protein